MNPVEIKLERKTILEAIRLKQGLSNKKKELQNLVLAASGNARNVTETEAERFASRFMSKFHIMFSKAHKQWERFENQNSFWLQGFEIIRARTEFQKTGRKTKKFEESCSRGKRMKTEKIRKEFSGNELAFAAQVKYRAEGNRNNAEAVKRVCSPEKETSNSCMSPEKALSIMMQANLTRESYNIIREPVKDRYPSYYQVTFLFWFTILMTQ